MRGMGARRSHTDADANNFKFTCQERTKLNQWGVLQIHRKKPRNTFSLSLIFDVHNRLKLAQVAPIAHHLILFEDHS